MNLWPQAYHSNCKHCFDTGVCFIHLYQGSIEMPLNCDCLEGIKSIWRLPQFGKEQINLGFRKEFPKSKWQCDGVTSLWNKADQWKATIKVAEEFWRENQLGELSFEDDKHSYHTIDTRLGSPLQGKES